LPLVYNTGAYDSLESLALMDGVVDIYMPDFKFWDPDKAKRYSKAPDYPEVARQAIKEMHRQVGSLQLDPHGLAMRGVLLRHLVMPEGVPETAEIMDWVARELGPDTYVNLMFQYRPAGRVTGEEYAEIHRCTTANEFQRAVQSFHSAGLHRLDRDSALSPNSCH
jgi:putative pyruvate formate lyase activating enzyme